MNYSKINNKRVEGEGHLQPGDNQWIGVFNVAEDLLQGEPSSWKSKVIEYEGPFDCRYEHINGKGKGQISHIRYDRKKRKVIINVEGIEAPKLERRLKKELRHHYNTNLPLD